MAPKPVLKDPAEWTIRLTVHRDDWRRLRAIALRENVALRDLIVDALRRDRVTKQAFQTKETTK